MQFVEIFYIYIIKYGFSCLWKCVPFRHIYFLLVVTLLESKTALRKCLSYVLQYLFILYIFHISSLILKLNLKNCVRSGFQGNLTVFKLNVLNYKNFENIKWNCSKFPIGDISFWCLGNCIQALLNKNWSHHFANLILLCRLFPSTNINFKTFWRLLNPFCYNNREL